MTLLRLLYKAELLYHVVGLLWWRCCRPIRKSNKSSIKG